ncbi:50S ribosomal protein L23 [Alkalispirochaeta sphaeroplastigenens]|uniref:Large ribosomal subunit protein uL23 n=1 Tax=Alkalispirochaeta sphaeroplastigenens TaxID=1187066 RepID=A0A2S4JH14_9SPIO|nr:50S ribosomal protein L23 [Alkalispirochaeta sphaeroplastigenens]POQ98759.1 50S ribosomal protein L23 [Alkalispirochaeta sphaeroplastigenens]
MNPEQIILEPILTEKTNGMREDGVYAFRVDQRANKVQVKGAVSALFGVHAQECRIINVKGKPKRTRSAKGRTSSWKKAVVTLAKGERISIFEGA